MQTLRDAWGRTGRADLFNDQYGILKLAADATLIKTSAPSKFVGRQWGQWRKRFLATIKQLWPNKKISKECIAKK